MLAGGFQCQGRELEDFDSLVQRSANGGTVLQTILEVLMDGENDTVLVELVRIVVGEGYCFGHVSRFIGQLIELEHVASAEKSGSLGTDIALEV